MATALATQTNIGVAVSHLSSPVPEETGPSCQLPIKTGNCHSHCSSNCSNRTCHTPQYRSPCSDSNADDGAVELGSFSHSPHSPGQESEPGGNTETQTAAETEPKLAAATSTTATATCEQATSVTTTEAPPAVALQADATSLSSQRVSSSKAQASSAAEDEVHALDPGAPSPELCNFSEQRPFERPIVKMSSRVFKLLYRSLLSLSPTQRSEVVASQFTPEQRAAFEQWLLRCRRKKRQEPPIARGNNASSTTTSRSNLSWSSAPRKRPAPDLPLSEDDFDLTSPTSEASTEEGHRPMSKRGATSMTATTTSSTRSASPASDASRSSGPRLRPHCQGTSRGDLRRLELFRRLRVCGKRTRLLQRQLSQPGEVPEHGQQRQRRQQQRQQRDEQIFNMSSKRRRPSPTCVNSMVKPGLDSDILDRTRHKNPTGIIEHTMKNEHYYFGFLTAPPLRLVTRSNRDIRLVQRLQLILIQVQARTLLLHATVTRGTGVLDKQSVLLFRTGFRQIVSSILKAQSCDDLEADQRRGGFKGSLRFLVAIKPLLTPRALTTRYYRLDDPDELEEGLAALVTLYSIESEVQKSSERKWKYQTPQGMDRLDEYWRQFREAYIEVCKLNAPDASHMSLEAFRNFEARRQQRVNNVRRRVEANHRRQKAKKVESRLVIEKLLSVWK